MKYDDALHRVLRRSVVVLAAPVLAALLLPAGQAWAGASPDGSLWHVGQRTSVDRQGSVYVTESRDRPGTHLDYVTSKYDRQGTEVWVATYDGPASRDDRVQALAIDGVGYVYVTGRSQGRDGTYDYATVKYGPDGRPIWVARHEGAGEDSAKAIAVGAKGDVYVTGVSGNLGGGGDYVTIHYDRKGVKQWIARYDGPGRGDDLASGIALDGEGFVYVTGKSTGAGGGFDYATVKYARDGSVVWVARYSRPGSRFNEAFHVEVDASGHVVVRGMSYGPDAPTRDLVTVTYGRDGRQLSVESREQAVRIENQNLPGSLSASCKPPRWTLEVRNIRPNDSMLGTGDSSFEDSLSDGDRTYGAVVKAVAADLESLGCLFFDSCTTLDALVSLAGLFDNGWGEQRWDLDDYRIVLRLDGEPGVQKRISVESELEGVLVVGAAGLAVAEAKMQSSLSFDGRVLVAEDRQQGAAVLQCRAEGVQESRAQVLPAALSVGDELTIRGKLRAEAVGVTVPGYGLGVALSVFDRPLAFPAGCESPQVDVSQGGLRFAARILNDPPDASCRNVTVAAGPACTADASIDNGTSDSDCDAFTLAQVPSGPYALGDTVVSLTATETGASGGSDSCSGTVSVEDLTPPTISGLAASPSVLWPPDHRLVPVTVTASARDNCGGTVCRIVGVTSNQPAVSGSGDPGPDWTIAGDLTAVLRSERLGDGSRVYAITVECRDGSGNGVSDVVTVSVPHDLRRN